MLKADEPGSKTDQKKGPKTAPLYALAAPLLLGLMSLTGCGRSDQVAGGGTLPPSPVACQIGYVFNPYIGQCVPGSYNYGYNSSSCVLRPDLSSITHDVYLCSLLPALTLSGYPNIPYLPSASQTQYAWWGPQVIAGDQIELLGAMRFGSIGWGVFVGDCKNEQNASSIMRGAVGSSYFSLPFGQVVTVTASGSLRVGMSLEKSCYESENVQLKLTRPRP